VIGSRPPVRPRPLPVAVAPLHQETVDSYINRLAWANRIGLRDLHHYVQDRNRIGADDLSPLDFLSELAGQPPGRLLRAMPELRTSAESIQGLPDACRQQLDRGWVIQPVCSRCLAAKGVITPARRWSPISTRLCLRHGRWTDTDYPQLDIMAVPDVVRAQRTHHRLAQICGWERLGIAWQHAERCCWRWWDSRRHCDARDRRIFRLCGPDWSESRRDPRILAAAYPDIVELTKLLAMPTLSSLPFTGRPADLQRFLDEVRARVAPDFRLEHASYNDSLRQWLRQDVRPRTETNAPDPDAPNDSILIRGTRTCPGCDQQIQSDHNAAYCSESCRTKTWYRKHKRHDAGTVRSFECLICDASTESQYKSTKYCSERCRVKAYRLRRTSTATQDEKTTTPHS
jgi:hypothetical protein